MAKRRTGIESEQRQRKPAVYNGFLFPDWSSVMPTVVKDLPAQSLRQVGTTKYDKWLDGQVWKFTPKDLEKMNIKTLRSGLYRVGRLKNMQVIFRREGDNWFIQAMPRPSAGD
jgi:hypothetical protein